MRVTAGAQNLPKPTLEKEQEGRSVKGRWDTLWMARIPIQNAKPQAGSSPRGWTTCPNPAYRFLLNVWLHLRWLFTQMPRRGHRQLDSKRFQLTRFAKFIIRAPEQRYGCVHEVVSPAVPLL